ncbi:MAG: hypothetical protein WC057_01515 [Dehalococcoidales bacterium]
MLTPQGRHCQYALIETQGRTTIGRPEVEKAVGKCRCGCQYKMNAKPRCPKCRSDDYKGDEWTEVYYD